MMVHVTHVTGPGQPSKATTMPVDDNPGHPLFYRQAKKGSSVDSKHLAFFPLTNIVNTVRQLRCPPVGYSQRALINQIGRM